MAGLSKSRVIYVGLLGASALLASVSATADAQELTVSPSSFDHGNIEVATVSANQTFQLENTSFPDLFITDFATSGADCADFVAIFPAVPVILLPGESTTMEVAFSPGRRGGADCDVVITSNTGGTPGTMTAVPQSGTGIAGAMQLTTTSISFGDQRIGAGPTAPTAFTIRNIGELPLDVTSTVVVGAHPADFAVSGTTSGTLAPAESFIVSVVFDPTAAGARAATVRVSSDDPVDPVQDVSVSGTGTEALVVVTPMPLPFGATVRGSSSDQTLMIDNPGDATLNVTDLGVVGGDASQFSLVSPPALPFAVAASGTQDVTVRFAPTSVGSKAADVSVVTDADTGTPNPSVAVTGLGVKPDITVLPGLADISFGDHTVGATSASVMRTVSNADTATTSDLTVTVSIGGAAAAEFSVTPSSCVSPGSCVLSPGSMQVLDLQFTPGSLGTRDAVLQINSDDQETPALMINLSGNGVALDVDAGPIDAGAIDAAPADAATPDAAMPVVDASLFVDAAPPPDAFVDPGDDGGGCGCSTSLTAVLFVVPFTGRRRR